VPRLYREIVRALCTRWDGGRCGSALASSTRTPDPVVPLALCGEDGQRFPRLSRAALWNA